MERFDTTDLRGNRPTEQAVILKAIYYSEPDFSPDDAILAEIVMHGGDVTFSSRCRCCNRREITALFGDRAKALEAGELLEIKCDAEVEILPFGTTLGGHSLQDDAPGG